MAGPTLYSVYASTMKKCVPDNVDLHGYADDHALKKSFLGNDRISESDTKHVLENSLKQVKTWMDENRLKMNHTKTEFILFGSRQQLVKCTVQSLTVNDCDIPRVNVITYLGAYLDESLTLKTHIRNKCRIAMANYHRIKKYKKISDCGRMQTGSARTNNFPH